MRHRQPQMLALTLAAGLLAGYLLFPAKASAAPAVSELPHWLVPLVAPAFVVSEYRAPITKYGAGHRGMDYNVRDRQTIFAPESGTVAFSGLVAKKPVVTVRHPDGLVSAYEPACTLLPVGASVLAGQPMGSVCANLEYESHCAPWLCLHFSVRRDGQYLSPRVFIGGLPGSALTAVD